MGLGASSNIKIAICWDSKICNKSCIKKIQYNVKLMPVKEQKKLKNKHL